MMKDQMRVGIATDHGGFGLKEELDPHLRAAGYEVIDFGAYLTMPDDDYPDFVIPLAEAVANGRVERGVAICGSGVGVSVCANKIPGIRAALIPDHFSARQGVEDDHINIICLGGRTDGAGRGLGFGADVPGGRVQPGRTTPAPARESGRPGAARRDAMSTPHLVEPKLAPRIVQLSINTIRTLSIDAVEQAKSGHPGTPMALAPLVYTLWNRVMQFDPQDPIWPNRDRFVLSNGHASMLLWSVLHLTGTRAVNSEYERLGIRR